LKLRWKVRGIRSGEETDKDACIWEDEVVQMILLKCSEKKKWKEELVYSKWFSVNIMFLVKNIKIYACSVVQ
jgi:hypothetical protein